MTRTYDQTVYSKRVHLCFFHYQSCKISYIILNLYIPNSNYPSIGKQTGRVILLFIHDPVRKRCANVSVCLWKTAFCGSFHWVVTPSPITQNSKETKRLSISVDNDVIGSDRWWKEYNGTNKQPNPHYQRGAEHPQLSLSSIGNSLICLPLIFVPENL